MHRLRNNHALLVALLVGLACSGAWAVRLIGEATDIVGTLRVRANPPAAATRSLVQMGSTAITGGSASGTYLGVNAAGGYAGDLLNLQKGGASQFKVTNAGVVTATGGITTTTGNLAASTGTLSIGGASTLTGAVTYGSTLLNTRTASATITENATLTSADSGAVIKCATDGVVVTLPATAPGYTVTVVNTGAPGAVGISLSPNAADKIMGCVTGEAADDKDVINTKATAMTGDMIRLVGDGADGWWVQELVGTWEREAGGE
jgi:hypothetical protein